MKKKSIGIGVAAVAAGAAALVAKSHRDAEKKADEENLPVLSAGHLKRCDSAFDGDGCLHLCADSIRSVFGSDFGSFVGNWRNGADPSGHPLF